MNFKKVRNILRAKCKISDNENFDRLAVQSNKNDLQDFDAIPELPAGTCAEIFCKGGTKIRLWHSFAL